MVQGCGVISVWKNLNMKIDVPNVLHYLTPVAIIFHTRRETLFKAIIILRCNLNQTGAFKQL
jgi:hypothetical protein